MYPCGECGDQLTSPLAAEMCADQDRADEADRRSNSPFRSVN